MSPQTITPEQLRELRQRINLLRAIEARVNRIASDLLDEDTHIAILTAQQIMTRILDRMPSKEANKIIAESSEDLRERLAMHRKWGPGKQ
jgi:hypothetical protein